MIGGGFAGAAIAFHLARAGVDVVVLEREATAGRHASGRNAALCRQLAHDDAITALCRRGAALLRRPPAGLDEVPLLRESGSLLLGDRPARVAALAAAATRAGLEHRAIDADQARARWPLLAGAAIAGGIEIPSDGVIEVRALLDGLLRGTVVAGGRVELGVDVTGLVAGDSREGRLRLITSAGDRSARVVVIASGAWAGDTAARIGGSPLSLRAERRHLFVTAPVAGLDRDAPFVWIEGEHEVYARPDGDGLLLSGCDGVDVAPADVASEPGAAAALADRLARAAPALAALPVASARACLRSFAPDGRPVIGWDPAAPHLFRVAALGGHGATSALAIGERAAAELLKRFR